VSYCKILGSANPRPYYLDHMSKRKDVSRIGESRGGTRQRSVLTLPSIAALVIILIGIALILTIKYRGDQAGRSPRSTINSPTGSAGPDRKAASEPKPNTGIPGASSQLERMEAAQAVMVTVDLDFGSRAPTIADALREIERGYKPDDGTGRTFAILDAYGEPTPDGKLHISMHVSSEKPGIASLTFKRTGEILWNSRIVPATHAPASQAKNLLISLSDASGNSRLLDGSGGIASIMNAKVKDLGTTVRDYWPDGSDREVTFVYSACGCPVKIMARRTGERTIRTKELPVIFPDDPGAVLSITKLMGW